MRTAILLLPLVACGDGADTDTDHDHDHGEDPAVHACEEVGSGTAVDGGTSGDTAPELTIGTPYTVALDEGGSVYVRVVSTEDVGAILWVGTADVVNGLTLDGVAQTLPAPAPSEVCADDIPEHYELDLEPGTWEIELGPAAVADVWLLVTESEGHGAHR